MKNLRWRERKRESLSHRPSWHRPGQSLHLVNEALVLLKNLKHGVKSQLLPELSILASGGSKVDGASEGLAAQFLP